MAEVNRKKGRLRMFTVQEGCLTAPKTETVKKSERDRNETSNFQVRGLRHEHRVHSEEESFEAQKKN